MVSKEKLKNEKNYLVIDRMFHFIGHHRRCPDAQIPASAATTTGRYGGLASRPASSATTIRGQPSAITPCSTASSNAGTPWIHDYQ
jgi:hypothetical protein